MAEKRAAFDDLTMQTSSSTLTKATGLEISTLNRLAADGLVQMLDEERQLFCYRLTRSGTQLVREEISHRYTIMTILGLHRFEAAGGRSPIEIAPLLNALLKDHSWIDNIGDVGLMLWLCAVVSPNHLQSVCSELRIHSAPDRFKEFGEGRTMELAWFLTGLAHATIAMPEMRQELEPLATRTYLSLKSNQGNYGFLGHQAAGGLAGLVRGRIGSFADQVYPIYAFTRFAQAYGCDEAFQSAHDSAKAICRAQGPLGQWWWHYNAANGRVFQPYPVYSVHQDGMAPMALFAIGDATGEDYNESIYKGLAWISGNNELSTDLCDLSSKVIWRSIYRKGWKAYASEFFNAHSPKRILKSGEELRILFECRPYHLGWLLYAFAGRDGEK